MSRKARWKGCCISCVVVIGLLIGSGLLMSYLSNREIIKPLEVRNPTGTRGQMLVVYRPGISAFPDQIMNSFVDGAIARDWVVTISVVSDASPTNLTGYDLLMFLAPVYGGIAQKYIVNYIMMLDDLQQKPCVVITTSGSGSSVPTDNLTTHVEVFNGTVVAQASYGQFETRSVTRNAAYQLGYNYTLIAAIIG
jgi:hypothetical protein